MLNCGLNISRRYVYFSSLENARDALLRSGFYSKYIDVNFTTLEALQEYKQEIYEQFIICGNDFRSHCIFGGIGVGKSTFITQIARALSIFLAVRIEYITMPRLLKLITSIDKDDKEKLKELERCCILFVDDVGLEVYTTTNQESLMRDFFAYRYGNNLTNFLVGNSDVRLLADSNLFYRQLSDYINDSGVYKVCKMQGKSRRT
jgi:DNA replication protein DnaC